MDSQLPSRRKVATRATNLFFRWFFQVVWGYIIAFFLVDLLALSLPFVDFYYPSKSLDLNFFNTS